MNERSAYALPREDKKIECVEKAKLACWHGMLGALSVSLPMHFLLNRYSLVYRATAPVSMKVFTVIAPPMTIGVFLGELELLKCARDVRQIYERNLAEGDKDKDKDKDIHLKTVKGTPREPDPFAPPPR